MRYELKDLRLFKAIVDAQNLSAGATAMHMTASSASYRLKNLEYAVGSSLFDRTPRGMKLTAAGEVLLRHTRKLMADVDIMHNELRDYSSNLKGSIRLLANMELLTRLKESFPQRLAGIKDSSGDAGYARQLGALFGDDLVVLTGNDALFSLALDSHAGGCITAMANLYSPELRLIWENHQKGEPQQSKLIQERLTTARTILDRYLPFPPLLKALVSRLMMFPRWSVRPPLLPLRPELEMQVEIELQDAQVAPLSIFDLAENHVDGSNPG